MSQHAPEKAPVGDAGLSKKGLSAGTVGLIGAVVIGISCIAPAYTFTAAVGPTASVVGSQIPAIILVGFIPMLLVAFGYRELNNRMPDAGTSFTWAARAFGPWIGWIGGWGLAVSAIIVLANVAEIAGIYTLRVVGLDGVADSLIGRMTFGVLFIAIMTYVSYRGILLSERMQNVLVGWQFTFLAVLELAKEQLLDIVQEEPLAPIYVKSLAAGNTNAPLQFSSEFDDNDDDANADE